MNTLNSVRSVLAVTVSLFLFSLSIFSILNKNPFKIKLNLIKFEKNKILNNFVCVCGGHTLNPSIRIMAFYTTSIYIVIFIDQPIVASSQK